MILGSFNSKETNIWFFINRILDMLAKEGKKEVLYILLYYLKERTLN